MFNGAVGKGGICTWEATVECADPALLASGADEPMTATTATTAMTSESMTMMINYSSAPTGFCGRDLDDAKNTCRQPCVTSEDCCSFAEACFTTACAFDVDHTGSSHYYCGTSWCTAADTCSTPCPSGADAECPNNQGCFFQVPCGDSNTMSDNVMSFLNANAIPGVNTNNNDNDNAAAAVTPNTTPNPNNFYCGSSPTNAAEMCTPCPTGRMDECNDEGEYGNGCFEGITTCTTLADFSLTMPNNQINDNMNAIVDDFVSQNIETPQLEGVSTTAKPTLEPTLPPWTNAPFNPSPTNTDKTVIGYYASWQWYDRDKFADPQNIDFSKYDRINYAFFQPCPQGNLYGTDKWGDPQLLWGPYVTDPAQQSISGSNANYFCSWDGPLGSDNDRNCNYHEIEKGLVFLAHAAGVEVMPSIGGWTLSNNFSTIAASATKRLNFARQCADLIDAYGFDGIDIDWEYPGYEDHSGRPEDTVNFTLLLQAIRSQLDGLGEARGITYGLTAALPCGPDKIEKIQVNQIKDILTEFNLMSYDLHGAWDDLTGTNAPMFDQGWTDETPRWSVHGCVNNYVDLGVPLSKMNIGLPFYGRSFQGATGMKQFHGGVDDINYHLDEGSPQYFNIVNELSRMTTYRHENTQTQYATFNTGGLVSYDDPRAICDKVAYANQRGMNGFLIWEISGDMIDRGNGNMITPLIDAVNNKIRKPNFDCATLRDPSWALSDQIYRYAPDEPDTVDWSNYVIPMSSGSANDYNGAQSGRNQGAGDDSSNQSKDDCPIDYTGTYASAGCMGYVYCQDGEVVGSNMPCVPGTLFDVTIGVCQWAAQVVGCGPQ